MPTTEGEPSNILVIILLVRPCIATTQFSKLFLSIDQVIFGVVSRKGKEI